MVLTNITDITDITDITVRWCFMVGTDSTQNSSMLPIPLPPLPQHRQNGKLPEYSSACASPYAIYHRKTVKINCKNGVA